MVKINQFPAHRPAIIDGVYRLQKTIRVELNGLKRTDAILADESGTVRCIRWDPAFAGQTYFNQLFECHLLLQQKTSRHTEIRTISARLIKPSINQSLKQHTQYLEAPRPDTVDRLYQLIERCPHPLLQRFIRQVFEDTEIAEPFFRLPASQDYHHDYPGGLVEHSLETADIALSALPIGNDEDVSLTLTAALFHDVGKIRTLTTSGFKTTSGRVMRHEQLTLECLAGPLSRLESVWSDGATALRYLLTYTPEQHKRPVLPCAMAIHYADRMSTSLSARAKSQENLPAHKAFSCTTSKGPKAWFWHPQKVQVKGKQRNG